MTEPSPVIFIILCKNFKAGITVLRQQGWVQHDGWRALPPGAAQPTGRLEGCVEDGEAGSGLSREEYPDRLGMSALGEELGGGVYAIYGHLPQDGCSSFWLIIRQTACSSQFCP